LVTGPYFHDGSQETLWDVIDHYNKGDGLQNPYLDEDIQPLALTEPEIDDLVAFLASLTSAQYREQGAKELARQREIRARTGRNATQRGRSARNRLDPSRPALDAIMELVPAPGGNDELGPFVVAAGGVLRDASWIASSKS
jgi:hypothetical protein